MYHKADNSVLSLKVTQMQGVDIFIKSGNTGDDPKNFEEEAITQADVGKLRDISIDQRFFIAVIPKEGEESTAFEFEYVTNASIPNFIEEYQNKFGTIVFYLICASPILLLCICVACCIYIKRKANVDRVETIKSTQDGQYGGRYNDHQ